eukprot:TRINITY_DN39669_c0_g1_i1.p2 TRINITY_DN39669_c0_g1~~TRINITY_DN39669_c0_g1_i1.p2  ORF type:complete len:167 (-),score=39.72 TRINITY_DN39669_c0_g1_i1:81-581(-)
MSALPDGWAAADDGAGNTYYYNATTGESSWEVPAGGAAPSLPDGWMAADDGAGNTYYYNATTGESSWEIPAGAPAEAPKPTEIGTWSIDNTYTLGAPGEAEGLFEGKAQLLDPQVYGSVSAVVNNLNANDPYVAEGYCVVFSQSKNKYFLLWRSDQEDNVKLLFSI